MPEQEVDVLRVCLNRNQFTGDRIRTRQFAYAQDTNELVIRRPDGQYRYIGNYDDYKKKMTK